MPNQLHRLDRPLSPHERDNPSYPLPPNNVQARSPKVGQIDIRWDDPNQLLGNQNFRILGVNVYRSFDTEHAGFTQLNTVPVGGNFWRDESDNEVITEDVSARFLSKGSDDPNNRWVFRVSQFPIVQSASQAIPATSTKEIEVRIDGQLIPVLRLWGTTGEVELINAPLFDPVKRQLVQPVLPGSTSVVTCTYRANRNLITNNRSQRIWYRLTTVALTAENTLIETPLEQIKSETPMETETVDYIWREAIRRNRWILEQGGERVKVFIRRWQGIVCPCTTAQGVDGSYSTDYHKNAASDCSQCFGTGILGGYDGPFDIIVAPREAPREVRLTQAGLYTKQVDNVWTSPSPLLNQRDFLVKQNNDRFSIGAISIPSSRGTILQQQFDIHLLPEGDIRYRVPMEGLTSLVFPKDQLHYTRYQGLMDPPGVTDKANTPDHRENRGRTKTFENIEY